MGNSPSQEQIEKSREQFANSMRDAMAHSLDSHPRWKTEADNHAAICNAVNIDTPLLELVALQLRYQVYYHGYVTQSVMNASDKDSSIQNYLIATGSLDHVIEVMSEKLLSGRNHNNIGDVIATKNYMISKGPINDSEPAREQFDQTIRMLTDLEKALNVAHVKLNNNQGAHFNGNVTMTAMVKYDNKLLNDMDLLSPAIKEYGVSRVMNAVLNFDSDFIDQIALARDEDMLYAGIISFEDYTE